MEMYHSIQGVGFRVFGFEGLGVCEDWVAGEELSGGSWGVGFRVQILRFKLLYYDKP